MLKTENFKSLGTNLLVVMALAVMIFLSYRNTFDSSWHLDDRPNITDNKGLHISDLSPGSLVRTFYTSPQQGGAIVKKPYRPIPCLTFALNWYIGQDRVFGYHLVNLIIHWLVAVFLFYTIKLLLNTPNLAGKYQRNDYLIAFLAAALWALNPIQTQAVTYIVQRMTSMAAMFYVLSIFFYLKFRLSRHSAARVFSLLGCLLGFFFALASKENTVTLPIALFLIEVAFLQDLSSIFIRRRFLFIAGSSVNLLILVAAYFNFSIESFSFFQFYKQRPFTMWERLLTESRIVVFYLSQLFYPAPYRLSIDHDIDLSTSFLQPWTTLPSILMVLMLIGFGFSQIRRRPLVALSILFFFFNHLVESTIIPIELIFEHRNYLPSLFVFLPVAMGIVWLYDRFTGDHRLKKPIFVGLVALLIVCLGWSTHTRNSVWATEKSLWEDAMIKAPGNARPLLALAWNIAYGDNEKPDEYDKALALYAKALPLKINLNLPPAYIYNNMAGIYDKKQDYDQAIKFYEKAITIEPGHTRARFNLVNIWIYMGKINEAEEHIDVLLAAHKDSGAYLNIKGLLLLKQKNAAEALSYLKKAWRAYPYNRAIRFNLAMALSLTENYQDAQKLLKQTDYRPAKNITTLFCLIENSVRAGDIAGSEAYAEELLSAYKPEFIRQSLNRHLEDNLQVPLQKKIITTAIESQLAAIKEK